MEHRYGTRYPSDISVCVSARSGALTSPGLLSDLSISGGFIKTSLPIEPLNCIALQLPPALSSLRLHGQIVRRTADGIAVEWDEYASELVQQVLRRRNLSNGILPAGRPLSRVYSEALETGS